MREIVLLFQGDKVKIFAEGSHGIGTEKFTEEMAKSIGTIVERHKGLHPHGHGEHTHWEEVLAAHRRGE